MTCHDRGHVYLLSHAHKHFHTNSHNMSQSFVDTRATLYIDALQSQLLHDRSLEVSIVGTESISIYKIIYLGSYSGHNTS